jgi:hypothetical protein
MLTKANALLGGWEAKGRRMLRDFEFGRDFGQTVQNLNKRSVVIRLFLCGRKIMMLNI